MAAAAARVLETIERPSTVAECIQLDAAFDPLPGYSDLGVTLSPVVYEFHHGNKAFSMRLRELARAISHSDDPINIVMLWQEFNNPNLEVFGRVLIGCSLVVDVIELQAFVTEARETKWRYEEVVDLVSVPVR